MVGPADAVLGDTGPIARALGPSYEARDQQLRMAAAVERSMEQRSHLLVEAGTGVGKSFAYLVPAIRRAVEHGETVVVSTHTIALQEQILHKDIPLLTRALGLTPGADGASPLRPCLVKGRGNYLSLRRLKLASERAARLLPDAASRRSLQAIEEWAYTTEEGTLASLPQIERPGVWDRARSDSGNCMGRKCPTYDKCFYQTARREMERANLLVTNHALFFSELAMRARSGGEIGFLPRYDQVVLDEAHTVEEVAGDHFGLSLTEGAVHHLLGQLYHERTGKGFLAQLELASGDLRPVETAVRLVREAENETRVFFDDLARLMQSGRAPGGRLRRPGLIENGLTESMNRLVLALRRMKDETRSEQDKFELVSYAERASDIADSADALVTQSLEGCCYWLEGGEAPGGDAPRGRSRRIRLSCSPIEVGPLLRENLFDRSFGVVMTSATLATRHAREDEPTEHAEMAFAHCIERTGAEGAETLQLGSPFDYRTQMELYIETSMPDPRGAPSPDHVRELASRILDHVTATDGGAFVLFTSFAMLERAALELAGPLDALGHTLLVQGRGPGGGS
ncbi:MAG: DEAD/DEAH box helicase, partial [Planctomycetota bacterium]